MLALGDAIPEVYALFPLSSPEEGALLTKE